VSAPPRSPTGLQPRDRLNWGFTTRRRPRVRSRTVATHRHPLGLQPRRQRRVHDPQITRDPHDRRTRRRSVELNSIPAELLGVRLPRHGQIFSLPPSPQLTRIFASAPFSDLQSPSFQTRVTVARQLSAPTSMCPSIFGGVRRQPRNPLNCTDTHQCTSADPIPISDTEEVTGSIPVSPTTLVQVSGVHVI
jgi:hypothetical protein